MHPELPTATKYRAAGTQLFSATSTFGEREAMFFAKDNKAVDAKELDNLKDDPALEPRCSGRLIGPITDIRVDLWRKIT
ncbi:MAG: hypothetical protein R3C20_15245 [Planctomycetaceae bacterium]